MTGDATTDSHVRFMGPVFAGYGLGSLQAVNLADELGKWLAPEDFSALKEVLRFHCDDEAFERIAAQFPPE